MSANLRVPGTSVATRVLKGAVWLTAARVTVNLIGLASTLIMARLLAPADFGLIAIVSGVLAIAGAATSLPLATVLVQIETLSKRHLDTAWTMSAIRGVLITLLMAALAFPLSKIYGDTRLAPIMLALSPVSLLSGLNSTATAVLTRELQFWQDFVLQSLAKAVGFAAGVLVAVLTQSYWALVAGSIAGTLAATIISFVITRYRPSLDLSEWRTLLGFSVWLTLSELVNTANWRTDQLIIGWRLGPTDLGHYTVGGDIAALPTREATTPLTQTLFPAFATMGDNRRQLAAAVAKTQGILVAVALPVGIGFALLADRIVPIVLGEKWLAAIPVIQVLSCLYGFQTIALPTHALAMARRENRALFFRDVVILATRIPLVIGGMFAFGLMGAVWGRAIAGALHVVINLEVIKRLAGLGLREQLSKPWRSILSAMAMVAAVFATTSWLNSVLTGAMGSVLTLGAAAAIAYGVTHVVLWRLAGSPAGAETEVWAIFCKLTTSLVNLRSKRL